MVKPKIVAEVYGSDELVIVKTGTDKDGLNLGRMLNTRTGELGDEMPLARLSKFVPMDDFTGAEADLVLYIKQFNLKF